MFKKKKLMEGIHLDFYIGVTIGFVYDGQKTIYLAIPFVILEIEIQDNHINDGKL